MGVYNMFEKISLTGFIGHIASLSNFFHLLFYNFLEHIFKPFLKNCCVNTRNYQLLIIVLLGD